MNQSNAILTKCEEAFALNYIQETVRLEMQGPAHKLWTENGLSDIDFSMRMSAFRYLNGKSGAVFRGEECLAPIIWPWPGMTSTEIIDLLRDRKGSTSKEHESVRDDGLCSLTDLTETKEN